MKPVSLVDRQPGHNRGNGSHISAETRPLSPPDTEISSQLDQYATPPRRPSLAHQDSGYGLPTIPATPDIPRESAGARFRRLAGIPTAQSGPREFRGASRPQTRWLIVLMPPSHLTNELAVGHRSPGRIANGLLIPLFPALFAQLTAIAKEFSLPSTTGLCLYLHLPDAPTAPRITDETWPLLWSRHLHTDDSALPLGLPVAGRVEFDIDVPNARWYPMWFAHVSRHELVPDLARTIPPSPRGAGRDLSPNPSIRAVRSVPRPLALVPRDEPVVHVDSAPSPAPSPSRPSIPKAASKETVDKVRRWSALVTPDPALRADAPPTEPSATEEATVPLSRDETTPPLAEAEDEPLNFEDFQWSVTSAGPPSPTSSCATSASSRVVSIHLLERNEGSVLLTPTTATTWGPPSVSDIESDFNLNLGWRVHSPDIGERAEGSVLLTPSTATSWGAPLSYPPTPAQWIEMQQLVRSPDLGERAEGSVLLTPSTATTWGAPLSYPPTPAQWYAMQQYVRSPDAGQRAEGSVLLTPSTATTWGAPETYPPTPEAWSEAQRGRVASPDLGARAEVEGEFGRGRHSTMVWGTEVETEQEAYARMGLPWVWEFGWPMLEDAGLSIVPEGVEQNIPDADDQEVEEMAPVVLVTREGAPEMEIEPYDYDPLGLAGDDASLEIEGNSALDEGQSGELYMLGSEHGLEIDAGAFEYDLPSFEPVPVDEEDEPVNTGISSAFEYELPHFELVEGEEEDQDEDEGEYAGPDAVTPDTFDYPLDYELHTSDIRAEHTAFVNSPNSMVTTRSVAVAAVTVSTATATTTQTHNYGAYPYLILYPAVYPHLELYPAAPAATVSTSRSTLGLVTQSQVVDATVDVEHLQIVDAPKPTLAADSVEPSPVPIGRMPGSAGATPSSVEFAASPVESIRSASSQIESSIPSPASRRPSLSVHVPRARSSTIVAVNPADGRSRAWSRTLPPVPPVPREVLESLESKKSVTASAVPRRLHVAKKPSIVLEDTEFELLPSEKKPALSTAYPYRYPYNLAQLYPSVRTLGYPYNLDGLYPSVVKTQESARVASVSALAAKSTTKRSSALLGTRPIVRQTIYPVFDLYPAAYPHNLLELYPPVLTSVLQPTQSTPTSNGSPAVKKQATSAASRVPAKLSSDARVRLSPQYPTFDLFPAVYPHNLDCIYPTSVKTFAGAVTPSNKSALATKPIAKSSSASPEARPVVCQKGYPVFDLYPAVYPYNLLELYPPVLASISQSARSAGTINGNSTVGKQATSDTPCAPAKRLRDVRVRFPPQYPVFDLFPAVYPHNLDCIYPTYIKALVATAPVSSKGTLHKELSVPEPVHTTSNVWDNTQSVYFARVYPNIELYAPVYPFNLDIYPSVRAKSSVAVPMNSVLQQKVSEAAAGSNTDKEVIKPAPKTRKTHAQLYAEARRKTHAQLVAEVAKDTAPARIRKTHDELQAEVSPGGLPSPVITAATSPQVMVTLAMNSEPSSAPQPAVAPLRRQRSGTIMMRGPPALAESVPPVPPLPQGTDLARSRSMLEARTQMFERTAAPARSQTISAPRLVRGKNASFERAMSLFHEETGKTGSEGSRTPPRVSKTISKLDMSKFKFS